MRGDLLYKRIKNQFGASVLISTLVMMTIGVMGLKVVEMASRGQIVSGSEVNVKEAEAAAHGGLEAAMLDLDRGDDPTQAYTVNGAQVTITADPTTGTVTAEGVIFNGETNAKKSFTSDAMFSDDDIILNTSHAYFADNELKNLYFEKIGTRTNKLDKLVIRWNESYCARLVTCDNEENPANENDGCDDHDDDDCKEHGHHDDDADENDADCQVDDFTPYLDPGHSTKILVCHNPSELDAGTTLSISQNVWNNQSGHCRHTSDYLGACALPPEEDEAGVFVVCAKSHLEDAEKESLEDYCSETSGGKTINKIKIASAVVYQSGSASSGSTIDINDVTMASPGNYNIDLIQFSGAIVDGTWFTVQAFFKDGSVETESFQVRTYSIDLTGLVTAQNNVHHGVDFTTENQGVKTGEVTIFSANNYVFTAEVLGSQMTCGQSGPAADVTARVFINDVAEVAFGGLPLHGGEIFTRDNLMQQKDYVIEATASMPTCNNYSKTVLSTETSLAKILLDGEAPPSTLTGFGGQQPVSAILSPYISDGKINLTNNQVIILMELGNDVDSANADFQDLVILVTITKQ